MRRALLPWLGVLGCSAELGPSAAPDAGPLPCVLVPSATRLSIAREGSAELGLDAPMGACLIERVRLDRAVFQIADEPSWPLEIPAGGALALRLEHRPSGRLPPGVPVRELMVFAKGFDLTVILEGPAPAAPCLELSPPMLELGPAAIGDTARGAVMAKNGCARPLLITRAEVTEGAHSFSVPLTLPSTIPAGATANIAVRFTPIVPFAVGGELRFETDDPQTGVVVVGLVGRALAPRAFAFPRAASLGSSLEGCSSRSARAFLANAGSSPLTVRRLTATRGFELLAASRVGGGVVDPVGLALEGSSALAFELRFTPPAGVTGEVRGTLTVEPDAGDAIAIELHSAVTPSSVTERFTIERQADVILVVEDPFTLRFAEARLMAFAEALLRRLEGVDNRVGMTPANAEAEMPGVLDACPAMQPVLRSTEETLAARQEALRCALSKRRAPATRAASLEVAVRTAARNLDGNILRAGARAAVVLIAARDDAGTVPLDAAAGLFLSPPGRATPIAVHVLAAPSGCSEAVPAPRLVAIGERLGAVHDLCAADWIAAAERIADAVRAPIDELALSAKATPGSFALTVDGMLIEEGRGFRFDVARNTVKLLAPPPAGSRVELAYEAACP